jgi:hypothetical protein
VFDKGRKEGHTPKAVKRMLLYTSHYQLELNKNATIFNDETHMSKSQEHPVMKKTEAGYIVGSYHFRENTPRTA